MATPGPAEPSETVSEAWGGVGAAEAGHDRPQSHAAADRQEHGDEHEQKNGIVEFAGMRFHATASISEVIGTPRQGL